MSHSSAENFLTS
uniref:Uncharacterized protein n=1 Tax=Rhizophora mucronata TaxID=61149 RepID=A0A2P2LSG8_RHIMU